MSYLNFVVTNGLVLVPAYWREGLPEREREKDEFVRQTLQRLFPERRVVQINPLDVNWSGGGMHCITQQQPRVPSPRSADGALETNMKTAKLSGSRSRSSVLIRADQVIEDLNARMSEFVRQAARLSR